VPVFSWRILWLLNLPTGLILVLMGGLIPESAKFLLSRGRAEEAHRIMARFGTRSHMLAEGEEDPDDPFTPHHDVPGEEPKLWTRGLAGKSAALSIAALSWGFINFGLLLWLPRDLVDKGYSMGVSSRLLAESALIAFPTVFLCAGLYSRWSTKGSLATLVALTLAGLGWVLLLETRIGGNPVLPIALLIVGSNGLLAILLPYASECYPLKVRGRATGWVAACTKTGGVFAQLLSILDLVPRLGLASLIIMVPLLAALILIIRYGTETKALDLRDLERDWAAEKAR
jgi:putative MFS transporter